MINNSSLYLFIYYSHHLVRFSCLLILVLFLIIISTTVAPSAASASENNTITGSNSLSRTNTDTASETATPEKSPSPSSSRSESLSNEHTSSEDEESQSITDETKTASVSESITNSSSLALSRSSQSESFTQSVTRELSDFAFNISNYTGVIGIMPLNVSGEYAPVNVWSRSCSAGWNIRDGSTGDAICTQAGFDFPVWNSNIFRQWDEATTATADAGQATNYIDLGGLQCTKGNNTLPRIGTATCGFQPSGEDCTSSSAIMIRAPWSVRCWSTPYNFIFRQDLDGTVRINANGNGADHYGFMCKDNFEKVLDRPEMRQSMCNILARANGGAGLYTGNSTVANLGTANQIVDNQSDFIINEYFCPLHHYNSSLVLNSGDFGRIIEEKKCSYFQNTPHVLSRKCNHPIAFALDCKTEPINWQFAAPAIDASLRGTNPALYDSMFFERSNSPREDNFGQETRLLLARLSADDANPWGVVCPSPHMDNDTAIFMCRKSGLTKTVRAYYGKVNASRAAINFINPVYNKGSVNVDFQTSVNFNSVKNGITNPASITSPEIDHAAAGKGSSGNISSTYLPIVLQNLHNCRFHHHSTHACSDDYIQSSQWLHRNSSCNPDGQDALDSVFIQTLVCVQDPEADSSFELAMNLTNGAVLINETDKNGDTETNGWGTLCQSTSEFEPTTAGEGGITLCSLMRWPGLINTTELTSISNYEPSNSVIVGRNVHCVPWWAFPQRIKNPWYDRPWYLDPARYDGATFQQYCHYENETVNRERHSTTCPRISVNCHIDKNYGWYFAQSNLSGTVLLRPRHGGEDLTTNPWGSMVLDQSLTESEKNTVAWHVCKLLGWGNDLSPSVSARNHYNQTQRASQSAYELGRTTRTRTLSSTVFWGELSEVQANVNNWDDLFWIEGANGEKFQRNSRDLHPLDLAVDCYRDPAYWDFTQDALTGLLFAQYHRSRSESTFSRTENKGQVCTSPDLENDLTTQLMMCKQLGWVEPVDAVVKTRADYTWNEIILKNEPTSREENAGPILLSNMTACPFSASDIGDCEFYLESLPRGDIIRNLCNHQQDIVVERCEQKRTTWEFTQDRISSLVKVRPSSSSPFGTISNGSFALLEAGVDSGIYPNIETALYQHNTMQNDLGVKNSICRLLGFTQGIISARTALEFLPLADKLPSDIRAVMDHPVYFSNMNCTLRSIVDNNLFDCNYTESSPTTDRSGVFVGNMAGDDVVIGAAVGTRVLTRTFTESAETHTVSQTVSETDLFNKLNNVYRMFAKCKTEAEDFEWRINMTYGGRLEVRPTNQHSWGTVCNKGPWSDETDRTYSMPQETMVALCRMAGMPEATFAKLRTPKNTPVNDDSIVYLQNLNCSTTLGQKSYTLDNCDNSYIQDDIGLNRTTCTHDDDVALFCYTDNATFTHDSSSLLDTEYLNSNDTTWQFTAEAVSSPTDDRYVLVVPNRTATPGVVCANTESVYHDSTDRALCHFLNFPGKITESTFERDGAFTGSPARPTYLSDMNCSYNTQEGFTRPTLGACDLYLQSDTHVPYHTINRNDCATNSIIYKSCKSEPSDFRLRLKHQGDPLELTANQALDAEYGYLSLSSAASKTNNSLMSLCYKLGWHNPVRFTADIGSSLTVNTTNPILVRNLECAFPQTSTDHWYDAQSNTSFTSRTRGIYPTCNYEQYSSRVTPPTSLNAETTLVRNLTCHANVSNWEVRIDKATQIVYTRPSPSARWGTVCFNDMNIEAATTLCHQSGIRFIESISFEKVDLSSTLVFPSTPQYLGGLQCANNATFSLDDGILDDGIRCQFQEASEETLLMPHLGCSHKTDTKINCVPVSRTLSITPPPTATKKHTVSPSATQTEVDSATETSEATATPDETRSASSSITHDPSPTVSESFTKHDQTATSYTQDVTASESNNIRDSLTSTESMSSSKHEEQFANRQTALEASLNTGATIAMFLGALFVQPVNYVFFAFSATCLLSSQHEVVRESTFSYYLSPPVEGFFNSSAAPLSYVMPTDVSHLHQRYWITFFILFLIFVLHFLVFGFFLARVYYQQMSADNKDDEDKAVERIVASASFVTKLRLAADSSRFPAAFIIPFQLAVLSLAYQSGTQLATRPSDPASGGCAFLTFLLFFVNLLVFNIYFGAIAVQLKDKTEIVTVFDEAKNSSDEQQKKQSERPSSSSFSLSSPTNNNNSNNKKQKKKKNRNPLVNDVHEASMSVNSTNNNNNVHNFDASSSSLKAIRASGSITKIDPDDLRFQRKVVGSKEQIFQYQNVQWIPFFNQWDETETLETKHRRSLRHREYDEDGVIIDNNDFDQSCNKSLREERQQQNTDGLFSSSSFKQTFNNYLLPCGMYVATTITSSADSTATGNNNNQILSSSHNSAEQEVEEKRLIAALYYRPWWSCFGYLLPTKYYWFCWFHMVVAFVICFAAGLDVTNEADSSNKSTTLVILFIHLASFIYIAILRPYRRNLALVCVLLIVLFSILMSLSSLLFFVPKKAGSSSAEVEANRERHARFSGGLGWLVIIVSWSYFFAAIIFWYFENHATRCWRDRFFSLKKSSNKNNNKTKIASPTLVKVHERSAYQINIDDDYDGNTSISRRSNNMNKGMISNSDDKQEEAWKSIKVNNSSSNNNNNNDDGFHDLNEVNEFMEDSDTLKYFQPELSTIQKNDGSGAHDEEKEEGNDACNEEHENSSNDHNSELENDDRAHHHHSDQKTKDDNDKDNRGQNTSSKTEEQNNDNEGEQQSSPKFNRVDDVIFEMSVQGPDSGFKPSSSVFSPRNDDDDDAPTTDRSSEKNHHTTGAHHAADDHKPQKRLIIMSKKADAAADGSVMIASYRTADDNSTRSKYDC